MARKHSGMNRDAVDRRNEAPLVALHDEELITVAGGLTSAFSNVIKNVGDALSTMARKG